MQLVEMKNRAEVLRDIVVPKKFYNRIDVGVPILNEMFGGQLMPGIFPGSCTLFTGSPGAGKSTMALQLADLISKNAGKSVLYNAGEENRYMVKMRADRIGLSGSFCVNQIAEVDELTQYCDDNGVEVLFQDSLQMLRDGSLEGNSKIKSVVKKFQAWKEKSDVTSFIIGHSTKSGMFAGPNEIKHDADAHAHLKMTSSGSRVFELEKNRFGPSMVPYELSMSNAGVSFQQVEAQTDDSVDEPSATSKSSERRDKIVRFIKEQLTKGERISGYCFERFNVPCSGGYWRGMLSIAVQQLNNEGVDVRETNIGGRTHNFIQGA